jgi:hypothetical protein
MVFDIGAIVPPSRVRIKFCYPRAVISPDLELAHLDARHCETAGGCSCRRACSMRRRGRWSSSTVHRIA